MNLLLFLIGCIEYGLTPFEKPIKTPELNPELGIETKLKIDSETKPYTIYQDLDSPDTGTLDTGDNEWPEALDVLVVLDTSGSMGDDTLIHFGLALIPRELSSNTDWQMMMITADSNDTIAWQVLPSDSDPEWRTMEGVSHLLSNGGYYEEGIDAALAFQLAESSWFRAKTKTLIIMISDEDDQSEAEPLTLLSTWPQELEIVTVIGLEEQDRNPQNECDYSCSAQVGTRYLQIATRTVDICTTNSWSVF